ncbi:DUF4145 domain-containing protein [Herbaspirillum sp. WKF16]|uniref:DUF4145 domain-containing protein n=1 Tax=Herbaspirillum sp. WKF16 TaxID=3028312 RepID=UPI0023A9F2F1|nr:DUF4145 domain-containing protein [Herbaspirillum sp. WKF16]WDZ95760.1 DUF4145 domain-containing protein [Herbaspirillum sp. WKF16]
MTGNEPGYQKKKFTCPFCSAVAQMTWTYGDSPKEFSSNRIGQAKCNACDEVSIWRSDLNSTRQLLSDLASKSAIVEVPGTMIYPRESTAPPASMDLPEDCRQDYREAREILELSPRAAAALLRLIVQKLCVHFGEPGKNINADIASLVKKGSLNAQIQQALDVVRIVGNSSVHPGEIQVEDNVDLVRKMFFLVNYIVQEMITSPKQRDALFALMPEGQKDAILKRDTPKP